MITLYSKDFSTKYGVISSLCEAFVEEERNGLFELSFIMLNTDSLFKYIKEENIVVANANDTLLNQKFRIYMTRKLMNNRVEVFARHISFDLMYDHVNELSFSNQSCEYALNQLFTKSNFSKHFKGYSDIVNAQDFNIEDASILEAIVGKKGSVIDTFGTGAELLRDNENIHVLNKRGYDNEVIIEYKKNLTGFELEEDSTDVITRIYPYAYYEKDDNYIEINGGDYKNIYIENSYSKNKAEISTLVGNTSLLDANFNITTPGVNATFYSTFEMFKTVDGDYKISITSKDKKGNVSESSIKIKEPLRAIETIKDCIVTTEEGVRVRRKLKQKRILKSYISKIMKNGDYKGVCIRKVNISDNALKTREAKVLNNRFVYTERDAIDEANVNKFYQQQQWWIFVFHNDISDEQAIEKVCESTLLFELNEYEYDSTKSFEFDILDDCYLDMKIGSIPSIVPSTVKIKYSTREKVVYENEYVDSPLISLYATPRIKSVDYTNSFENEIPTSSGLFNLANNEFKVNNIDKSKMNFKIEFIPLSKCVGYEVLEDKINLCDKVTIIDARYGINTQAKVIKTTFNVIKNKYESIELGNFRTSLGDVITPEDGKDGSDGKDGKDGDINDFIDEVPSKSIVSTKLYGFSNIEISWTFENKVYYTYELYASKTKGFTPNTFDLIHSGKSSSFLFQAQPNETWYFRVCAVNTHGNRSEFSDEVSVTTVKINDLSNYVDNMAIGDALIGTLSLDRGWVGTLRGNYIDARQLSVTDGNGKRTLDIDSFGNVSFSPKLMRVYTDDKVELISNNGNKNMLLYGGQVCIYNNADDTFMSTMGNVLRSSDFNYKGIGFLAGKNCNTFTIGHDENWEDIQLDRSPSPLGIFFINFSSINAQQDGIKGIHLRDITYTTGDICGIGATKPSIYGFNSISASSMSYDNWRSPIDNSLIMRFNGGTNKLNLGKTLNANGYGAEDFSFVNTSRLYIDNIYALNNNYGKLLFRTDGWNMYNGVNWDWHGHNLLNPVIIGGSYGYSITPNTDTYSNVKTFNGDVNLDGILDKINIYPTQSTYRTNSERSLEIDVTELRESENADIFIKKHNAVNSEGENEIIENIDMKSMLHLALLEIKKLKEEVKALKMKVGM